MPRYEFEDVETGEKLTLKLTVPEYVKFRICTGVGNDEYHIGNQRVKRVYSSFRFVMNGRMQ